MAPMTEPAAPSTTPSFQQRTGEGPLLIADISGYTSFLQAVAAAHASDAFADGNVPAAYQILSEMLQGIVGSFVPPYTLSKLEGDAVFVFGGFDGDTPHGAEVLDGIRRTYAGFQAELAKAGEEWTCNCDACIRINMLDLKFIVHGGRYFVHEIAGSRELSGPDVVMAHRLLKNDAVSAVGRRGYALLTEAVVSRLGVPTHGAVQQTQTPADYPPVESFVYALG